MQYITIRDSKRIGNDNCYAKKLFYKDIHIHVLIKTVEGQDVESIKQQSDWITTAIHRVCREGNTLTITC